MVSAIGSNSAYDASLYTVHFSPQSSEEKGEINPAADESSAKMAASAKADSSANSGIVNIVV